MYTQRLCQTNNEFQKWMKKIITHAVLCFTNLADIEKSSLSGSGSDHTKSAIGPSCGISSIDNNRMSLSVNRCTNKTKVLAR